MMNENDTILPAAADAGAPPPRAPEAEAQPARESPSRPLPEDGFIILPVRNMVLFPGVVLPITIGRAFFWKSDTRPARRRLGCCLSRWLFHRCRRDPV